MTRVAIIGRVNVGKSTLFNKLAEKRQALVSDIPGTTRDLKYATIEWQGHEFELIDSGGFLADQKTPLKKLTKRQQKKFKAEAIDDIDKQVEKQARQALTKSQIVLLVVDARQGLNPQDKQIAQYLRKVKDKKIILVANKCDSQQIRLGAAEFHQLGLGEPVLVSAASGSGTGDLLDMMVKALKHLSTETLKHLGTQMGEEDVIKVSMVGKPNVGKSLLLNKLIGEEKAIVSPIAHTTREPNDSLIEFEDNKILLVDTAGIRRKARIKPSSLEQLGVSMSIKSLKRSQIVLLVLDAADEISKQDLQLGKLIAEAGKAVMIVANKYDLAGEARKQENKKTRKQTGEILDEEDEEGSDDITSEYRKYIYHNFPHLSFAPVVFVSAKTGLNIQKILKLIITINKQRYIKIPDSALNRFLKSIIRKQPPPTRKIGMGKKTKTQRAFITRFEQIDVDPPVFQCNINPRAKLPENYRKYIINQLRAKFGFEAIPIKLVVKSKQ
jgi:GTP-binding protein